ncbi:TetR/AcrR family transcriptional regulator [Ochrobactrum vermis]|uniref:TetR/AcrR family transcriptional regulator n=1 Tax=Ochrobactrum vermis TaxID=1827297 RepID=A0ABU8PKB3_9HYPH|nr:TetR/AcrR family transcriptional regulator [Ochrobactrum vermis]PQZ26900.1 TetR family transcriptional regulator [Ochrobactrum vermis]
MAKALAKTQPRKNDPDATRENILDIAAREFVASGFSGARVDEIAAQTRTSKRMIYYYFGSKDGLYLAVLERAYGKIRTLESSLSLDDQDPESAMRSLVESTFDHDDANPDFVRLVAVENIHRAEHMERSDVLSRQNVTILETIEKILERGREQGIFQRRISALDLHMLISAQCFFRVSNRHTFGAIFGTDLMASEVKARHRRLISDTIIALLKSPE